MGLLVVAGTAQAHHLMGGEVPATAMQGFLSGLAHPVIGLDHLAFVIAIGMLAFLGRRRRYGGALAFVAATVAGAGLHMGGMALPLAELAIALSLLAAGAMLAVARGGAAVGALGAVAGVFHGYAYAEAIIGAQTGPLLAYLAGFAAVQFAVAMGAGFAMLAVARRVGRHGSLRRLAGALTGAVGMAFATLPVLS